MVGGGGVGRGVGGVVLLGGWQANAVGWGRWAAMLGDMPQGDMMGCGGAAGC